MPLKPLLHGIPVPLPEDFEAKADAFLSLLLIWNRKMNLVSRKLFKDDLEQFVVGSLAPLAAFDRERARLLDVGSGGGFPALVLLMARPAWSGVLVEATRKKCLFLREAAESIGAGRIEVLNERLEDCELPEGGFDLITARAVRVDQGIARCIGAALAPGGLVTVYAAQAEAERVELSDVLGSGGLSPAPVLDVPWAKSSLQVASGGP